MERTRKIKKLVLASLLAGMIITAMGGCSYVNNKSWDGLTPGEKEEALQNLEEDRKELEADFTSDSAEGKFASYILDKVEQALEE